MKNPLAASLIIPTYNGAGKIHRLMDSLLNQSIKNIEIIVVIDGSTDQTLEVLKPYSQRFMHFKIIKQINSGRSIVRNNGAREANGEVLIFYDDDMIPFSDSVAGHIKFHATHFGILCGDPMEAYDKHNTDIQNYKAWISKKWTDKYADGITRLRLDNLFFTAANCSIPKNLFWQLNGFDQGLTDGEDYDIAFRAIKNNIPVYFDKNNRAFHDDKITCISYIKRLRAYSQEQRKWRGSNPQFVVEERKYPVVKKIVYKAFAYPIWAQLIDKGFFIFLFPKRLRYRLYSTVIQALANEHATVLL